MQYMSRYWTHKGEEMIPEYTNSQIAEIIDEHIHNERNREILKRRLIDGICFEPLAEEFRMSVRQIKYIIYREQDRLIKYMN